MTMNYFLQAATYDFVDNEKNAWCNYTLSRWHFLSFLFFFCISIISSCLLSLREIWTFQFFCSSVESKIVDALQNARPGTRAPTRFLAQFSTRLFSLSGGEEDPWSVLLRHENFRKFVEHSFSPARRILTRMLLNPLFLRSRTLRAEKFS